MAWSSFGFSDFLCLFSIEFKLVIFHRHFDFIARHEAAFEGFPGAQVQQVLVRDAFERVRFQPEYLRALRLDAGMGLTEAAQRNSNQSPI